METTPSPLNPLEKSNIKAKRIKIDSKKLDDKKQRKPENMEIETREVTAPECKNPAKTDFVIESPQRNLDKADLRTKMNDENEDEINWKKESCVKENAEHEANWRNPIKNSTDETVDKVLLMTTNASQALSTSIENSIQQLSEKWIRLNEDLMRIRRKSTRSQIKSITGEVTRRL